MKIMGLAGMLGILFCLALVACSNPFSSSNPNAPSVATDIQLVAGALNAAGQITEILDPGATSTAQTIQAVVNVATGVITPLVTASGVASTATAVPATHTSKVKMSSAMKAKLTKPAAPAPVPAVPLTSVSAISQ